MNHDASEIKANRIKNGARPVEQYVIPQIIRGSIWAAYRRDRENGDDADAPLSRDLATGLMNDGRWRGLFDHWGASTIPADVSNGMVVSRVLVAEPYVNAGIVEKARTFALWARLDLILDQPSWWFPGRTMRFEFRAPDIRS